jgi:hypothetical protein
MKSVRALAALLSLGVFGSSIAYEPSVNYMLQCMGCHGPDGTGEAGRVPALNQTALLFARMPEGRRYLLQVPGVAQSTLSDAELAELLNWMIPHFGGTSAQGFTPFTPQEVARFRKSPLADPRAERERLLALAR